MAVISSKNFIHSVTKQLALFIADSKVKVGERLPAERILVKKLKVSRSSIREVLKYWETLIGKTKSFFSGLDL
jgi:DNA-binding FadR family transcriptional regulator